MSVLQRKLPDSFSNKKWDKLCCYILALNGKHKRAVRYALSVAKTPKRYILVVLQQH